MQKDVAKYRFLHFVDSLFKYNLHIVDCKVLDLSLFGGDMLRNPVKNQFSSRLIQLREERNLSQKKLAEVLNINNKTINHYETGIREPDFDTLIIFADFFNVNTDFLLGRTEVKGRYQ